MEGTNESEGENSDRGDRRLPVVELARRLRREAAPEWILLLGSAASWSGATVGIVAMVMG